MKVKMLDNKVWSINFESVSLEKGESYDLSDLIANRICSLGFAEIDNGGEEKIEQEPEDSDIDTKLENGGEEKIEQESEEPDIDTKLENAEEPKRKKRGRKPKIE